jgi:tetratricopeptide (TPR) repeat protein
MPKRRTDDVVHVVMTDHYIQRRKRGDLLAEAPERPADNGNGEQVVAYSPKLGRSAQDQLDLAVAQVREVGSRNTATSRLARLIELYHPERADYYLEMADGLEADGESAKAVPFYEEADRRRPGSTVILRKLGTALMETRQLGRAAAVLQQVLKADPADPFAWRLIGQVYTMQGRNPEAIAAFEKALAADPDLPEARNNQGSLLASNGDLERAEREFRESMRIQPNLAEASANLARLLALNHDNPQAAYYFENAIRLKPDYASARLEYGRMLVTTGDVKSGVAHLQLAARSSDPDIRQPALDLLKKFAAGN